MEELEPRLLFSADSIAGLLSTQDATFQAYDSGLAESQFLQTEGIYQSSTSQSSRYEIVFIDAGVEGYQQLLADLQNQQNGNRRFEVYLLDNDRDGIEQISGILAGHQAVDAIHILSHGDNGRVNLGNGWLDTNNLNNYSDAIAGWSQVLGDDADLLFYGCDLAGSEEGKALVNALGGLTGADVAASDDLTGSSLLGGDWDLEYHLGAIESVVAFSSEIQQSWQNVLAVFNVDTIADTVDDNLGDGIALDLSGNTSLRAAIMEANALGGSHQINLLGGTYTLSTGASGEDAAAEGDLDITSDITIIGAGANVTIIDANDIDRVFHVIGNGASLTLTDLTVRDGRVAGAGDAGKGGGILVKDGGGQLMLNRVTINNNMADNGAGIFSKGTLTLSDVVISNNGDATTVEGGGLHNKGVANLDRVTISGNQATFGGGIHNDNTATSLSLTNVTVSGNSAVTSGGGLHAQKPTTIVNSTITSNTAVNGGGIHSNGGNIDITNTIIAGNSATNANPDVMGAFSSQGYNLIGDVTGGSGFNGNDLQNAYAGLGSLGNHGGFGQTHLPGGGSEAIDAGTLTGAPTIDQRGTTRPLDSNGDLLVAVDIGAVEMTPDVLVHAADTNTQETSSELRGSHQAIAMDSNGNYVVVWSSQDQDGSGWGVFAQRFNADGTTSGSLIPINVTTTGDQRWASVAMDATGQFAVVWTAGSGQDGSGEGIFMRRFDVNGNAIDNVDIQVNTGTTSSNQRNPSIAMNASGQMVICLAEYRLQRWYLCQAF